MCLLEGLSVCLSWLKIKYIILYFIDCLFYLEHMKLDLFLEDLGYYVFINITFRTNWLI